MCAARAANGCNRCPCVSYPSRGIRTGTMSEIRVDSHSAEEPQMDPERWERVARLYESALERDPAAREAFLRDAAGDDEALRREVESLLAQDATPVVIDRPVLEAAAVVLESGVFRQFRNRTGAFPAVPATTNQQASQLEGQL